MPLNTRIDVTRPSAFTIRNHAFGIRPSTAKASSPEAGKEKSGAVATQRSSNQS